MSAVTQWFKPEQPPVHTGIYETFMEGASSFEAHFQAAWDGEKWVWCQEEGRACVFQKRHWRGLTEESK